MGSPVRNFLFLQGPLSPLYARVADRLEAAGHTVSRINLNIGDRLHWRRAGAVNFRGRPEAFGAFVRRHFAAHSVTDLVLHGECRLYHRIAAEEAARRCGAIWAASRGDMPKSAGSKDHSALIVPARKV